VVLICSSGGGRSYADQVPNVHRLLNTDITFLAHTCGVGQHLLILRKEALISKEGILLQNRTEQCIGNYVSLDYLGHRSPIAYATIRILT
jgi:hypothetical protein